MKRAALVLFITTGVATVVATVVALFFGGFLALTFGSVAAAMLPPDTAAQMVTPYACPEGTGANIDSKASQCSAHNRNSGSCKTIQIDCVDRRGHLVKRVNSNSSALWLWGIVVAYAFAIIGGLLFVGTFAGTMILGAIVAKAVSAIETSTTPADQPR